MNALNGARILITRPALQAENLCQLITDSGGEAVCLSTIDIVPSANTTLIRQTLSTLESFQWLVFISANAVTMHSYHLNGDKINLPNGLRVVAIGQATTAALAKLGLSVDVSPEQGYNSEALLAMPQLQYIQGQRFLIVRGAGGREELATTLRARVAEVVYLDVYERTLPTVDVMPITTLLTENKLNVITTTSGEILNILLTLLGETYHTQLFAVPLVVVSERIKQLATARGFRRVRVSHSPHDAAILDTVITWVTEE